MVIHTVPAATSARQHDDESAALFTHTRAYTNRAAMQIDDPLNDGKTGAGAAPGLTM
ncbi:MAG: hypothetical protein ACOY9J_02535 [Pseudomonadota bacterium]